MNSASYDFIIIGSGVSGGRIAWELTRAGAKCLLLEAGREFGAKTFPGNELDYSTQMFWGGGLEITADGRLGLLRAKCLGGTSVVNQALLDRFDDLAWDDWRSRSGIGFLNAREMESHYQSCAEELSISKIPEKHWNRNARTFIHAFDAKGYGWKPLERAQGDCKLDEGSDCIVCLGGCPRESKQSSLITSIRKAREKGLEVLSEFEVHHLELSGSTTGIVGKHQGVDRKITAARVVLAAGAVGNSAILLRSGFKKKLPALGTAFTCHPQFMTYALFDEEIDAHKGAFQVVKSDDANLRKAGFKLENVYAPPIGTAMLLPGIGRDHLRRMRKYRHYASMEVAIRDDATGTISLGSGDKVRIDKKLTGEDRLKVRRGISLVHELFASSGAREVIDCPQTFGLHLMGGCPIGEDPALSVVSPEFRIHGHPNLMIADSSVFPGAPGINPSFTIMALSHRAAKGWVAR